MIHRYRINDEEWNLTNENYLLLPNLSPANYKLEIQSQNEDNIWSESSKLSFTIKKPWWRTYLFLSLLILGIALIVFSIVRTRLKSSEEKNKLLQEINQLEKSALSAQMSPHFIFNCLNSIQKYIMYKDKREAMEYLATFSGLIRMYLKASANDHISLAEEIKMLTHYLELEKLRFNSSFNFEIKTPPNSNFSSIKIPTMLIQPFVENAVLHGMKDKVDNNGSILVDIKREINFLHVLIEDNGQGIEHTKTEKNHDSMGMSITQKRLALIQDKSLVKDAFEIISTEEGTSIKIKIPFVEE
jgi:LytS/YehU family sensor histidine kinase